MDSDNRRCVDRARSGRTVCTTCGRPIAAGTPRVIDEDIFMPDMAASRTKRAYHHVACAIEVKRQLALDALIAADTPDDLVTAVMAEVVQLDPELAAEVRATREQRRAIRRPIEVRPLDHPRTEELLAELEAAPRDRGPCAVLADHLQQLGDERGELITLDLAASTDPDALARRRELTAALSVPHGTGTWGIGFLTKLYLWIGSHPVAELATALTHPSCRLLETLELRGVRQDGGDPEIPPGLLPASLRRLEISGERAVPSDFASLRYLESLRIDTAHALAHPTLRKLELDVHDGIPDPQALPAVRSLTLHMLHDRGGIVAQLVSAGWLRQLAELGLDDVVLARADVERLADSLGGRRLARLSIRCRGLTKFDRPRLQALCDELVFEGDADAAQATIYVEHANKPEWGRGRVVREFDGKVEVEFASGTRTFKADATFLVRSRA